MRPSFTHSTPWNRSLGLFAFLFVASTVVLQARNPPVPGSPGAMRVETAEELFQKASTLIEKENFAAAIPLLRQAALQSPDQARIYHYLGYALWRERQWDAAAAEFETALRLEPQNPHTKYFFARVYASQGKTDWAIKLLEGVIASGQPVYDTYQQLGAAYVRKGEMMKALEAVRQALKESPSDGALHHQLGSIYRRMGDVQKAQEEFEIAIKLKEGDQHSMQKLLQISEWVKQNRRDEALKLSRELLDQASADPEILIRLGALLGQEGYYQEALESLGQAAQVDTQSFEAHFNLGLTLAKLGRKEEAERSLIHAHELQPESFEVNATLATLYVEQNRNTEAIERLRAADRIRPDNVKILALLGQQYLRGRYLDEAIEALGTANHRLNADDTNLRRLLIYAYEENKEFGKALTVAEEWLKLSPSRAEAHFEAGEQLANLGRYQQARPYLEEAIRIDPSFTEAYNSLGDSLLRNGDYEAALERFQRAKFLNPIDVGAARGIAKSLVQLKRYQEAVEHLEKSVRIHPDDDQLYFQLSQVYVRVGNREKASQAAQIFRRLRDAKTETEKLQRKRPFKPDTERAVSR